MINFITISAPSGSGKTTLCKALRKVKSDIEWSVSYTTRLKRDSEKNCGVGKCSWKLLWYCKSHS